MIFQGKEMKNRVLKISTYNYFFYIIGLVLVSLQFLQVFEASVFQRDDLTHMLLFRNHFYFLSLLKTRPGKALFWRICVYLQNPVLVRFYILTFIWIGTFSYLYLCRLLHVDDLDALLIINLVMSFWFNAQSVYHAASSWGSLCWSFSLLSIVLFYIAFTSQKKVKKRILFAASILFYWLAVTRNPQPLFLPLIVILIIMSVSKSHLSMKKLFFDNRSRGSIIDVVVYISSTLFAFFIRWVVFGTKIHNYQNNKSFHFNININNAISHFTDLFVNILKSFGISSIKNKNVPPPAFFASAFLTLSVYFVFRFLYMQSKDKYPYPSLKNKKQIMATQKNNIRSKISAMAIFFSGFILTMVPILAIEHRPHRYYFIPGIYFTSFLILTISHLIRSHLWSKKKTIIRKFVRIVFYGGLLFLLILSSYNRCIFVDDIYTTRAKYYADFKKILNEEIQIKDLQPQSQVVLIGHPAFLLTHNKTNNEMNLMSSTGLLNLASNRYDISGYVIKDYYRFNSSIFNYLLKKQHPLFVFFHKNGTITMMKYLIDKEGNRLNLYKLNYNEPPDLIYSNTLQENLIEFIKDSKIASKDIWIVK